MKKFQFRLQTPLDIAIRQEQIAQEEMLLCIKHRDIVSGELDILHERLAELENDIRQGMLASITLDRMLLLRNFMPVLKKLREEKNEELILAEELVEDARRVLVERIKESKTLTRLREKEWQAYRQEVLREEQKLIDEVATTRYFRQNQSSEKINP